MDQAEEWRRLKDLYARMNEGELEVVANEAYDLTDVARPLLRDEIASRGLKIPLRTERAQRKAAAPPSKLDLVVTGAIWKLEDARTIKEFMDVAGIPSYWGPNHVENLDELKSSFDDGIDLTVREEDLARVNAGLRQLFPQEPGGDQDFSFECPKCQSPDIVFHDLDEQAKFNWSCDACGHEWKDDGVDD